MTSLLPPPRCKRPAKLQYSHLNFASLFLLYCHQMNFSHKHKPNYIPKNLENTCGCILHIIFNSHYNEISFTIHYSGFITSSFVIPSKMVFWLTSLFSNHYSVSECIGCLFLTRASLVPYTAAPRRPFPPFFFSLVRSLVRYHH